MSTSIRVTGETKRGKSTGELIQKSPVFEPLREVPMTILNSAMHRHQPTFQIEIADLIARSIGIRPQIEVPLRSAGRGNPFSHLRCRQQHEILLVSQGHKYKNPNIRLTLADLFRVERIPASRKNVPRKLLMN